jgi:hypothetical protein
MDGSLQVRIFSIRADFPGADEPAARSGVFKLAYNNDKQLGLQGNYS